MIELVTLFLMLTWGVRPVEVAVGAGVAAVEVRLDGDGKPVGKTRQTINFGRSGAEASLVLDLGAQEARRKARVVWQTYDHSRPKKMRARFDDRRVEVAEDGTIELPPYDPLEPHLLEAKLTFPDSLVAEAELSFGGAYSETVSSELTAVPVLLPAGAPPPRPAAMAGWFAAAGEPVPVFSLEHEPGVVFLVRDVHLPLPLPLATPEPVPSGRPVPAPPAGKASADELLFIATTPNMSDTGPHRTAIFLIAKVEEAWSRRGLAEVARYLAPAERPRVRQQLFEAIALAARAAAASSRPRAVVLLLDPASPDFSRLSAPQTLGYLRALRVPLFVWRAPGREDVSFASGALDDLTRGDLAEIVRRVEASLHSQHVVWFEGPYLPHQVELTAAAPEGVRFPF